MIAMLDIAQSRLKSQRSRTIALDFSSADSWLCSRAKLGALTSHLFVKRVALSLKALGSVEFVYNQFHWALCYQVLYSFPGLYQDATLDREIETLKLPPEQLKLI